MKASLHCLLRVLGDCGITMAGLSAWTLTILPMSMIGLRHRLSAGIWGHGGVASDGTNIFVITGNTFNTGGNWRAAKRSFGCKLDRAWTGSLLITGRRPIGSRSTTATRIWAVSARCSLTCLEPRLPSLVLALGKDGNAYLLNRNNLGGIAAPVTQLSVDGVSEDGHRPPTARAREPILFFVPEAASLRPTR